MLSPTPTTINPGIPTATGTLCAPVYNPSYEKQVLALINQERTTADLVNLVENSSLDSSARAHSQDMAINDFMAHDGSDGSTYWSRELAAGYTGSWGGEIIYAGSGTYNNPSSAVTWWMNDPPHKALILADYNDFGAGYAYCSGHQYGGFFTVDFGHR
jgi:uncharacterized protein YkwD